MDGDRVVGRIFKDANDAWYWGVDFMLTHRKSYGTADPCESAVAAFKAECERLAERGGAATVNAIYARPSRPIF